MRIFFKKGISLVEVLFIIGIVVLMAVISYPQFSKIKSLQVVKSAGGDVISSLEKAQSQTRASLNSSAYGVHFQSDKIIIFKGTTFSANDGNNQAINIISPATISNISLTGGASDIYFNRLTGKPSASGTVTISVASASVSKTITISATGAVGIN